MPTLPICPLCSRTISHRLNENICYDISVSPPCLYSLYPCNSLFTALHLLKNGGKEEKGECGANCSLALSKRSIYESKQAPTQSHSHTHTHKHTQSPAHKSHTHTYNQLVLKRLTPKKNEVTHLNIRTFPSLVNHCSRWYKQGNLINLEAADTELCGQSRENCCW